MPLTADQTLAAGSRGGARLVSAAAGSGKTKVLVERILRYVEEGADIDDFLVITYTRAAAGELRSRLLRELNQRVAADPHNHHLRRQTELCCRADIGTIDSICGRFLRENAHLAGIAPDFRVMEADRAQLMKATVLDRLMDSLYEDLDSHPSRKALIDTVGAGSDDLRLTDLILHLHEAIQSQPDPRLWTRQQREDLKCPANGDIGSTKWGRSLLDVYSRRSGFWVRQLETRLEELALPGREPILKAYGPALSVLAEGLRAFIRAAEQSWDSARMAAFIDVPRLGSYRGEDPLAADTKEIKGKCSDFCEKMEKIFTASSAEKLEELASVLPAMDALLELTAELDRAYALEKRRQGLVDFSDQEHMVLRLLEDSENGLARSLSRRYREVLVDEYQDVNQCQDSLFTLLSDGGRKLFLVGDVKQSVYRFRLANPGIFLEKYRSYAPVDSGDPGSPRAGKIMLRENFRSRPEIIDAVNHVFRNIMSKTLGEMDYDENAMLRSGRPFPEGAGAEVCMDIYTSPEAEDGDDEVRPADLELEASAVAARIREMVDRGVPVTEDDHLRPARYGDFAILVRSHKNTAAAFRSALAREGIPSSAQQGGGFFRSLEVTTLLSLLAVIDNPRQDVPLIAALRSPLYGLSPDELSEIRTHGKKKDFYTALCHAADSMPRVRQFLEDLEEYRALSADLSVEGLISLVITRTDLFALLSAMPDGRTRRDNVQMLMDFARQFELDGYRGLFGFLSWMKRLEERGEEPRVGGISGEEAVQIMTIHRSKGLEFPIVFLSCTAKQWNLMDLNSSVLLHPQLGVGCHVIGRRNGVRFHYPSLAHDALKLRLRQESLSEEMRVLYVAMTRAKDRLYVTALWKDPEKKLSELRRGLESPIAPELLEADKSFSQWLARTALLPDSPIRLRISSCTVQGDGGPAAPDPAAAETAGTPEEDLQRRLTWKYPMDWAAALPSKLTASALPREPEAGEDEAGQAMVPPVARHPRMPDFTKAEKPLTGTEKGIAVHTVLQFIDYRRVDSTEAVAGEIGRLLQAGHITPRQAEAVEPESIRQLFASPLGQRLLRSEDVRRELRFSLLTPAESWFSVPGGEEVLLQGVIDCCFREDDHMVVVDYKTDYVTEETVAARAADYAPQVRAYAAAVERMLKLPVTECVLFFLRLGKAVSVPISLK